MNKGLMLSAIVAGLLMSGCGESKEAKTEVSKIESTSMVVEAANAVKETAQKATEATKEAAKKAADTATEVVEKAAETTKEAVKEGTQKVTETAAKAVEATKKAVESTKETVEKSTTEIKEAAQKVTDSAEESADAVAEKAKEATPALAVDGATLFKACATCHGDKGEKKALGASQVIGGWEAAKVEEALKGYKAGTYGGAMKSVMVGQAKKLDDDSIKAVAEYISTLK